MYFASSYCLLKSNAKERWLYVYLRWPTILSSCILILFLLSTVKPCSGQDYGNIEENFSNKTDNRAIQNEESKIASQNQIKIHAFYGIHDYVKLNISWILNTDNLNPESKLLRIFKLEDSDHCRRGHNYYIKSHSSFEVLPVEDTKDAFIKGCPYSVEIVEANSTDETNNIAFNYTIPDTSPVKNLTVISIYLEDTNSVALNLSWDNPTVDILPTGYVIKVIPVQEGHCKNARPYETSINDANQSSALVPHDAEVMDIRPGCRYKINVISLPVNDLNFNQTQIDYFVTDCVGKRCSCKDDQIPPMPNIRVKQKSNEVISVQWNISTNSISTQNYNLTAIYFSISASGHFPIFIRNKTITKLQANMTNIEDIVIPDLSPGGLYQVSVWVENEQYCRSVYARSSFLAMFTQENHWSNQVVIATLFAIVLALFLCITCIWLYEKHPNWMNFITFQPYLRRHERPASERFRATASYFQVPMVPNNSYHVRKEGVNDELKSENVDKYEIKYNALKFGKEIGKGAFGRVFAASISGVPGYDLVAVKKLQIMTSPEAKQEFMSEIAMLKCIGNHPNIVTFVGCCTVGEQPCIVMEYVPCGDLLHYLRTLRTQYETKEKRFLFTVNTSVNSKTSQDKQRCSDESYIVPEEIPFNRLPSLTETVYTVLGSDIVSLEPSSPGSSKIPVILECTMDPIEWQKFAIQIVRGMEYLEQKQIVHRDLAARNILIDGGKNLKISDFGMSISGIYVNSRHSKRPLRWLSIEAIFDRKYTNKSDVWSFGIVLWEIGTLGAFPYPSIEDKEIYPFLMEGKRLDKPENCTPELYQLMQRCWTHCAESRPSFQQIGEYLSISNKNPVYIDFSQLDSSYVFPPIEQQSPTQVNAENNSKTEMDLHENCVFSPIEQQGLTQVNPENNNETEMDLHEN